MTQREYESLGNVLCAVALVLQYTMDTANTKTGFNDWLSHWMKKK
jgi:hypothetical protein